ncbi:MAG TPA: hypothetical protein VHA13_02845 [Gammaproteobacteria bacterium]|nr:hypothetical protein [Gammaproteobacteria bacterium]
MPLTFYPYEDDLKKNNNTNLDEKIEILLEAAERYKAIVLDAPVANKTNPSEIKVAYNWDGLASILREVREAHEGGQNDKRIKLERLLKLAEVYEVLRAAKMQKLEAVRLALVNEANRLRSGA